MSSTTDADIISQFVELPESSKSNNTLSTKDIEIKINSFLSLLLSASHDITNLKYTTLDDDSKSKLRDHELKLSEAIVFLEKLPEIDREIAKNNQSHLNAIKTCKDGCRVLTKESLKPSFTSWFSKSHAKPSIDGGDNGDDNGGDYGLMLD